MKVHSTYVAPARALIDPMLPKGGIDAIARLGPPPERILLTNRHHLRDSAALVDAFGCTIHCHEAGLHEFANGPEVHGFAFGDDLAPGITAREVDAICPEECALHIDAGPGALAFADGVIRWSRELGFVPDSLLGDDPEEVKAGLRAALRRLVDENRFDALLFAHGDPLPRGGHAALAAFAG